MNILKKKNNIVNLFCLIFVVALIETIIMYAIFNIQHIFFIDNMVEDPGGDFYLTLLYSKGLNPYQFAGFTYPPLTIVVAYIITLFDHVNSIINVDTSNWNLVFTNYYSQSLIYRVIFLLLCLIVILIIFFLIYRIILKSTKTNLCSLFLSLLILLNSGFLSCLIRGNLSFLVCAFLFIYLEYYNSSNILYKNLSLLVLALAFNIKPYVAIFGLMLLYDKDYKSCIKLSIVSLILFVFPFVFVEGGLGAISSYFKQLLTFGGQSIYLVSGKFLPLIITRLINYIAHVSFYNSFFNSVVQISIAFMLFIKGFYINRNWLRVLLITCIMIVLSTNYGYIFIYMMIPLTYFISEESLANIINLIFLLLFCILIAPYTICNELLYEKFIIISNIIVLIMTFLIMFFKSDDAIEC